GRRRQPRSRGALPAQSLDDPVSRTPADEPHEVASFWWRVGQEPGRGGRLRDMRALPAAIAVIALLVSGCGCDPEVSVPTASGPATSAAPPPPSDVPGRYGDAASTVREDSVYPDVGEPTIDALHYGLDLRWGRERRRLDGTTSVRFRATATGDRVKLDLAPQLKPSEVRLD